MPTPITVWGGVTIGPVGRKLAEVLSYYSKPAEIYITSGYRNEANSHHSGLSYAGSPTAALDIGFGGTGQPARGRDLARWLYDNFWDLTVELIHTTPFSDDQGFYVKNQVRYPGGGPFAGVTASQHKDHVHFATSDALADRILARLRAVPTPSPVPVSNWTGTKHFVDIASYQAGINVAALPSKGVSMVNIKTSEGTTYVFQDAPKYAQQARAAGLDIIAFHFLRAGSGVAQAQLMQQRISAMGGPDGMIIECDTEADASQQTIRDFIVHMQNWLGRPVMVYTGDWWWQPRGYNVSDLTPYVTAAPNVGYVGSYPGDQSSHWNAGYGGWSVLSAMQYDVSPLAGVGGGNLSKSAIRDPNVYRALTGKTGNKILPKEDDDMAGAYLAQDARSIVIVWLGAEGVLYQNIVYQEMVGAWNAAGVPGPFMVPDVTALGFPAPFPGQSPSVTVNVDAATLATQIVAKLPADSDLTVEQLKEAFKEALREGTE